MNIQPVNEMMPPRLLFQPGTSFLENNISSSLGEEENAENPTKGSGAELNPVAKTPQDCEKISGSPEAQGVRRRKRPTHTHCQETF